MSVVYVIADLHLGHVKLAEIRGFASTHEHDDAVVSAWNSIVTKKDVVYVLGDVFRVDRVAELRGTKKLALGNHDARPVKIYEALFSQVRSCFEFDNCILTHIPIHPSQFPRYRLNVHGHTHAKRIEDPRYIPVSVEHCPDLKPRVLRDLLAVDRDVPWRCGHCNEPLPLKVQTLENQCTKCGTLPGV